MNRLFLTAFILLASCYSKPTQSEPVGIVDIVDSEITIEFVAVGE